MPLPALAVGALAFAGSALASGPLGRLFGQVGNSIYPNGLLPLPDLISAWRQYWIRTDNMRTTARLHGVHFPNIDREDLFLTRSVVNPNTQEPILISQSLPPGRTFTMNERIIQSQQYQPTIDECMLLKNRGVISQELFDRYTRNNCNGDTAWSRIWDHVRYQIPGASDLVRFAVREAFTPQIVQQYGYHHEFPKAIDPWMSKQGFDQPLNFNIPPGGTNDDGSPRNRVASWMDLFWWSHWDLPSVGQGYEMVFRLYAASDFGPSPDGVANGVSFNVADMETLLKTADYPDYWRRRLIAINYQPFTRVDIRRMHQLDIADDGDVYHAYRAQGYPDDRAKKLLQFTKEQTRIYKLNRDRKTVSKLCELYIEGQISRNKILELATLFDVEPRALDNQLWMCETQDSLNRYKARVKAVRTSYLNGMLTKDELREALVLANVIPQRADQLMELWEIESQFKFKWVAANKARKWFKLRLIGQDEFIARLYNLHIPPLDITRFVQEVLLEQQNESLKVAAKNVKAIADQQRKDSEKAIRDKEKAAKALQKAVKEAERKAQNRLRGILSAFTDKNLSAWITDKLIDAGQVVTVLRLKGWEDFAIHSFLVNHKMIEKDDPIPPEESPYANPQTT